ncbi:C-C motif chemokine 25 [Gasterosteus aculeatus]
MRSNTVIFLLVLSGVCLSLAQTTFEDCCFKYVKKHIRRTQKLAVDYRRQVVDGGCNIPATIFTLRGGRLLCADPQERWVVHLMKRLDKRDRHVHAKLKTLYRS